MPRVVWREYLEGKYHPEKPGARRQLNHKVRERARQSMEDLTLIVRGMDNITRKPEKEYSRIFTGDACLQMQEDVFLASLIGRLYPQNVDPFYIAEMAIALRKAGVRCVRRRLYEKEYRDEMLRRLREKQWKTGQIY